MTKPYSEDLRTRVVAAVSAGVSCREAAQRFSIGVSSVVRWAQWFRRTGSVAAKPMGGDRNSRLKDERDWLRKAQRPEIQPIDKHVDHPHRVVLSNVVIQILGKQNALYTVFTLNEARHLTPPARIIQNYNSTVVFTQPRTVSGRR